MAPLGSKRRTVDDPSPRPRKIRRLDHGRSDVTAAMGPCDGRNGWSSDEEGSPHWQLVFRNASPDAIEAFDGTELVGVLDMEKGWAAAQEDAGDLLVDVPGAATYVRISRHMVLKQIADYLGMRIYGFGLVEESPDVVRGWVDMETATSRSAVDRGRQRFYSDEARTGHEAKEGACDAAIAHLRTACFVLVDDINYGRVRSLENRVLRAETFSDLLNGVLKGGELNRKAILEAHNTFFSEAKGICKQFAGVFGPGVIGMASTSAQPAEEKLYYGGPRPPVSESEKLAFALIELINRSTDVAMLADDVV